MFFFWKSLWIKAFSTCINVCNVIGSACTLHNGFVKYQQRSVFIVEWMKACMYSLYTYKLRVVFFSNSVWEWSFFYICWWNRSSQCCESGDEEKDQPILPWQDTTPIFNINSSNLRQPCQLTRASRSGGMYQQCTVVLFYKGQGGPRHFHYTATCARSDHSISFGNPLL